MARQRLAILGSGWGAGRLLKEICPEKYAVTVISPRNHMLFTPLLPAASVGLVQPQSICEPLRPRVVRKGARYCEAFAQSVDLSSRRVHCQSLDGDTYDVPFDRLIIAVGKKANDFGIPGVRKYAHFMKETADAQRLRESFLKRLEEAADLHAWRAGKLTSEEEAKIKQLLSAVVVGGGPTSVMFARELRNFISRDVSTMYPLLRQYISVHLVEWSSCTLNRTHRPDQALREYARERLATKPGVHVHQGDLVSQVTPDELHLQSGEVLPYGVLLWNAGQKAVPLVKTLPVPKSPDCSRLLLDEHLRCQGQRDIYAIGDCAHFGEDGLPQTAQVADQQAAYLARQLNNGEQFDRPFALTGLPSMTYAAGKGGSQLLSQLPGVSNAGGWLAWMAWRSSFLSSQLSLRSRMAIASDKVQSSLFGCSLTRLGEETVELPTAPNHTVASSSAHPLDEKLLSSILDDIGMRQVEGLMQMPRVPVAHSPNVPPATPRLQVSRSGSEHTVQQM